MDHTDEYIKEILEKIDSKKGYYAEISNKIWEFAEPRFQEYRSSELLQHVLKQAGFSIKADLAGEKTAFIAEYGSGKPVIAFLGEFDPDTISADKLVFIGDSRTEGLRDAVNDDSIWSCLSSMGYDWMVSTGVPQVEDQIEDNTAVIILMGVNDLYHVNDYISYINSKAAEWGNRGAQTYFVSVGPVQNDPYCSNAEIESFNAAMQASLSGVTYIDVYSHLVSEGFSTVDGTHYPDSVSVDIYNYILDHLEEQMSGIWG